MSNAAPHRRSWYRARNCHGKHFTRSFVVSGRGGTLAFGLRLTSSIEKTSDTKCSKRSSFRLRNSIRPRQIAYSAATAQFRCWICGQHIASDLGIRLSCLRCRPPRHKPSRHPRICRHRRSTASGHAPCRCPAGPPAAEQPSTKTISLSLPARPAHRDTFRRPCTSTALGRFSPQPSPEQEVQARHERLRNEQQPQHCRGERAGESAQERPSRLLARIRINLAHRAPASRRGSYSRSSM